MRIRFRPQANVFYDYFKDGANNADQACGVLAELAESNRDTESVSSRLVEIEHANDELIHELYNKVNSSFITPFDRDDMYRLGSRLDDIVDHLEAAGTLVHLYHVFPDVQPPQELLGQLQVLAKLGPLTAGAFERLAARKQLREYWVEANRLENEADRLYRMLVVHLFDGGYDAMTVLKLKEIADELEDAADSFELVANTVEAMVGKES